MKATEHKETGERMHVYEVSFLIVPTVSEGALPEEVSAIKSVIESVGGLVIDEDFPRKRNLAYTIEKALESKYQRYNEAYFGWFKFELTSALVSDIKKELDRRPSVLRHLIIKTVRENTMYTPRIADEEVSEGEQVVESPSGTPSVETNSGEIDKSIDALVTN